MKKYIDIISEQLKEAFKNCGYDPEKIIATVSNRPDLCEFQCNGAMALAKSAGKAPLTIAEEVVDKLKGNDCFSMVDVVRPGFININVSTAFLSDYVNEMALSHKFGVETDGKKKRIIVDYGGANVAKPLHIGHLRSAIIGESIKRICVYLGNEAVGDVHLGDWGLQMGQIIAYLKETRPDLIYFDDEYTGEYPKEPPFTISELEEICPNASKKCKTDEIFAEKAHMATADLQKGKPGYMAIWDHVLNVSIADLKKNYDNLNVSFELWKKESDAQPYIPQMIEDMKNKGIIKESEGALVVDISEETDKKELPPCIIVKSDGATLYSTTDLATLVERERLYDPDRVIYVVDKRQELHFIQVFRTARKADIVKDDTDLIFIGFGTMNGKDGKPFKTREGGVMRLSSLLDEISETMYEKVSANELLSEDEAKKTAEMISLAAIKYGDLSNQASKDYIFDTDKFTSFEGNTGPYILYTIVRIKSILKKYEEMGGKADAKISGEVNESELPLLLKLVGFNEMTQAAYEEKAPHKVCQYIYELANAFNRFYHETRILTETDKQKQQGACGDLAPPGVQVPVESDQSGDD